MKVLKLNIGAVMLLSICVLALSPEARACDQSSGFEAYYSCLLNQWVNMQNMQNSMLQMQSSMLNSMQHQQSSSSQQNTSSPLRSSEDIYITY